MPKRSAKEDLHNEIQHKKWISISTLKKMNKLKLMYRDLSFRPLIDILVMQNDEVTRKPQLKGKIKTLKDFVEGKKL